MSGFASGARTVLDFTPGTDMNYDPNKAVRNIKSKTIDAPKNDGQWDVVCEVVGCDVTTQSSKMHGWSSNRWVTCPNHGSPKN